MAKGIKFNRIFDFTESEYRLLSYLDKKQEKVDVKEVVEFLELDRTTVQKIMADLFEKGILLRTQLNMQRGFKLLYWTEKPFIEVLNERLEDFYIKTKNKLMKKNGN